jgi:aryl-alcohol dehydrogenase-like predicted oxidoreductase
MGFPGLSRICFGCEPLGGVDWGEIKVNEIADAIARALDIGINFFDTADVYGLGLSESRLSSILGAKRHDVVITTKGGISWSLEGASGRAITVRDSSPGYLRSAVDASLARLRLDRIPIYLVHWPDSNTDIRVTFDCLMSLKSAGKIQHIGCSNFSVSQIRSACEVADVSFLQLPLNILDRGIEPDLLQLIEEKSLKIMAYNVLANGLLTGKYTAQSRFPVTDRRSRLPLFQGEVFREALSKIERLSSHAAARGLSCAQFAISEIVKRSYVTAAVLGIKNCTQLDENCLPLLREGLLVQPSAHVSC